MPGRVIIPGGGGGADINGTEMSVILDEAVSAGDQIHVSTGRGIKASRCNVWSKGYASTGDIESYTSVALVREDSSYWYVAVRYEHRDDDDPDITLARIHKKSKDVLVWGGREHVSGDGGNVLICKFRTGITVSFYDTGGSSSWQRLETTSFGTSGNGTDGYIYTIPPGDDLVTGACYMKEGYVLVRMRYRIILVKPHTSVSTGVLFSPAVTTTYGSYDAVRVNDNLAYIVSVISGSKYLQLVDISTDTPVLGATTLLIAGSGYYHTKLTMFRDKTGTLRLAVTYSDSGNQYDYLRIFTVDETTGALTEWQSQLLILDRGGSRTGTTHMMFFANALYIKTAYNTFGHMKTYKYDLDLKTVVENPDTFVSVYGAGYPDAHENLSEHCVVQVVDNGDSIGVDVLSAYSDGNAIALEDGGVGDTITVVSWI